MTKNFSYSSFNLWNATSHTPKTLFAIMVLNEIEWTIFGVFLNLSLSKFKGTHINLKELRGHRCAERLD